ncbi:CDP-glycerol glycerophosphotransferase family protein [Halomonas sp. Bachu 37]|uniref:CDP-glycerol glycerophosphotransferase family protein n=1 Tax=Halomonas kashgarensis TaxID=3084920 RepID=UPI0032167832
MSSYAFRLAKQLTWMPLCLIGWCFPRNDRLWVFGAWHGRQFADNASYLYRHVRDNEPDLRAVWLAHDREVVKRARDEGGEAYLAYSAKGILVSLRARLFLVTHSADDVNAHASLGGQLINLTHGTPLKRLVQDARSSRLGVLTGVFDRYLRRALPGQRSPHQVLVASEIARERMMSAFGLSSERVVALGYPRWDAFRTNAAESLRRAGIDTTEYDGVVLYAPTLRMQGKGGLDVAQGKRLEALMPWFEKHRLLLLIRGHTSLKMNGVQDLVAGNKHIREAPVSVFPDVNALFPAIDMLITDYSSLMYDYACLKRPIVLMAPDLDDYLNRDVGIYGDYFADAPGPVIESWEQLPESWQELFEGRHDQRLVNFVARHAVLHDGRECERMTAYLRNNCRAEVISHA